MKISRNLKLGALFSVLLGASMIFNEASARGDWEVMTWEDATPGFKTCIDQVGVQGLPEEMVSKCYREALEYWKDEVESSKDYAIENCSLMENSKDCIKSTEELYDYTRLVASKYSEFIRDYNPVTGNLEFHNNLERVDLIIRVFMSYVIAMDVTEPDDFEY